MALLGLSTAANAGTQTGLVYYISMRAGDVGTGNDSLVYLMLTGTRAGKPACATSNLWFIRDSKSEIGKQQIALLMTAKAAGKAVTITGTGACTRWSDGEDIFEISWAE